MVKETGVAQSVNPQGMMSSPAAAAARRQKQQFNQFQQQQQQDQQYNYDYVPSPPPPPPAPPSQAQPTAGSQSTPHQRSALRLHSLAGNNNNRQ